MSVTSGVGGRRRRRSSVVSAVVLAVLGLVVAGLALRFEGLSSSDIDVSDGGVWVLNRQDGLMGRVNVDARELDARVTSVGDDLDVLQSGYAVFERGARGLTPIDASLVKRGGTVELAPGTQVALGGDRVAIAMADGRVWVLSVSEAAAFDPGAMKPVVEGKKEPVVSVTSAGTVLVLDGETLSVIERAGEASDSKVSSTVTVGGVSSDAESVELSSVGETPVVLDRENRLLRVGSKAKEIDLTGEGVTDFSGLRLQQPSPTGDSVLVATPDALLDVPLGGGKVASVSAAGTGEPVSPVQMKDCNYAAWNGSRAYVRACEGSEAVSEVIDGAKGDGDLVLRQNRDLVVLNDQQFGLAWMIAQDMQLVDEWQIQQEIKTDQQQEKEEETLTSTITNVAKERDQENHPPVANDDEFGVRAGASVVLPVVRNDTDPDGDVLTVSVSSDQPGIGTVTPIQGGTQLQIEVKPEASGSATFEYTADDGRGGKDTANVTVNVVPDTENSEPRLAQDTVPKVKVRSGEEVSFNVLPYWEDPDGDAFYLAGATIEPEDVVSFRADGLITFTDAGLATGEKQVDLVFRDEHGASAEGVLQVEVVEESDLAPITTADHAQIVAGRSTTIKPLVNDLNPNGGKLELTHVSESEGLDIDASLEAGTVNLTAGSPGTHYLEYTVASSGASSSSLGLIRVDVVEAADEDLVPVAVDDMGAVISGSDTLVDPLSNDVDPTGGVLVVNRVTVPPQSGLKATVIDHHLVRIEAEPNAKVSEEPVPLEYEVANSAGSTTGTIRVMIAQVDTQFANPIAVPDQAVVRAGDMVIVPVLSNDVSPTDASLSLGKLTQTEAADGLGHVETTQDMIRFTANDDAEGEAHLTYETVDATGRTGSARLSIRIVPADAGNEPPRPENLTARTVAGTPVRIPVRTTGIDPDGDSVVLMGTTSPTPTRGDVTKATGEWIEYVPHEGEVGTDRFRYQVMDRHGAIGTAEVLVGIAEPAKQNQPPFAVDDVIEARPDRELQIPVLANDTDPEGQPLSVDHSQVEATTDIEVLDPAGSQEGMVTVRTPAQSGTHTVLYAASDGQLTSPGMITVKVDENAQPRAPIARDDFVEAADVLDPDAEYIDIDVLANDSDPDGSVNALTVELMDGPDGAELLEGGVLRVKPPSELTRVRYKLTDPDDLTSYGYVWIPGTAKQAPVWVGGTVEAKDGGETRIDLSDPENVRVRPGAQPAQITDPYLVSAEHTDGSQLVQDGSTLVYRPAQGYSGPDTITVEVTDGEVGDATAASATLQIPVTVKSEETNLPPTLQGTIIEPEPGGPEVTVDLSSGAKDPEGDDLTYALGDYTANPQIDVDLQGSTLSARADAKTRPGTSLSIPVTVSDGTNDPVAASVQVRVVSSSRPLVAAVRDEATIDAGQSQSIPVLANDSNPFPDGELKLTGASLASGSGTVQVTGNEVSVAPDKDFHGILTATYTVQDTTGDPAREVTGEIRTTVRGYPEPPSAPRIGQIGNGTVELQFTAGADNGAPITGYQVRSASGPAVAQDCPSTSCTITGLTNDVEYTFQVVAINEVGESDPSTPSAVARPDVRPEAPPAPTAERGDSKLTVSWGAPVNEGSAIQKYDVQIRDGASGTLDTRVLEGSGRQLTWDGLTNGVDYSFRVRAHNLADEPSDWSAWSKPEHPAGRPGKPGGKLEASRVNDPLGGGVTVTWPKMSDKEANGEPITQYIVKASSGASQTVNGSTTQVTFRDLDRDSEHSFTVTGVNSVGPGTAASAPSNTVVPWAVPDAPSQITASMPDEGKGDGPNGRANISWKAADGNGTAIEEYVVRWSGGSKTVPASATSASITGLTNGKAYTFTVQAKNRFQGGESPLSKASNSVTPYTKPGKPRITSSTGECSSESECPITFRIEATSDGGGGGVESIRWTLDNGATWPSDGGDSVTAQLVANSGQTQNIEVEVVNARGLKSTSSASATAKKWSPPTVAGGKPNWEAKGNANNESGCTSASSGGSCTYFTVTIENLAPHSTHTVTYSNNNDENYATFTLKADKSGRITTPRQWYGFPKGSDNPLRIAVDNREIGSFYSP